MNRLRAIWLRIRSLWQRREVKREIDEELRFHLEPRTAENLAAGMSPEDATREARKQFGNAQSIREECRDAKGASLGEGVWQDVRFGTRMLWKNPGFTTVAALSLALGIGANTTVFCWIQSILIRPFAGAAKQEELVVLTTQHGNAMWESLSLPDLKDQARLKQVFAGVIGSTPTRTYLTADGRVDWLYGQLVTANFFDVLGVKPLLGRAFRPEEDGPPGGHPVMVISESYWRSRFAGDPHVVGRTVLIGQVNITIIGVMPGVFRGTMTGFKCDFWGPLSMCQEFGNRPHSELDNRSDRWVNTQARLQPGMSTARAQAALDTLAAQLERAYPESNREITFRALPLWKSPYGGQAIMLPVLSLLLAVSLGVLLMVAVNVANLLLARASRREKEIAIRLALGAGRRRLIRQLLTESLLLSSLGGVGGVLLANWMVELARFFLPHSHLPLGFAISMDGRVLLATMLLTLVTGVIFGLAPAWQTSRPQLNETLKDGGRAAATGTPHHRLLNSFVVAQIALALVLLVCAGLCLKGLHKARQIDLGFDPQHLLFMGLGFTVPNSWDGQKQIAFCETLQTQLATRPEVQGVAFASSFPLGFEAGGSSWGVDVEGYPHKPNEDRDVRFSSTWPGYFALMRIPLLNGRDFTERDEMNTLPVAIINEAMARRFWPGQNPIGRRFIAAGATRTVVGVTKTGKYRSLTEPTTCYFYIPYRQWPFSNEVGLCLRTTGNPVVAANAVRQEVHKLNSRVGIWGTLPMADFIQPAFLTQQIASGLLTLLGMIALALAAIGVYGVMAYVVSQRAHEFGVRMALGANRQNVLGLVARRGLMLAASGVVIGLVIALGVSRHLANFLHGVSPFDAVIFMSAPLLLGLISLLACWLPARRATKVSPMEALRCD